MKHEFTAVIEQDGEWYIAYCPEIPGPNGQGRTIDECRASLADAIDLILEDRREDGSRGMPDEVLREYIQRRTQAEIVNLFGKVEFDPAYDYRRQRRYR
jgi:predicted RNase H-like HicB family nuclease